MEIELAADCSRCAALCCVALPFAASADFALDKAAGVACPNLAADHRCTIHGDLRGHGFAGCVAYDCLGAGQQTTQVSFGGRSWRTEPAIADVMFATFRAMRPLHELLVLLAEAIDRTPADGADLRRVQAEVAAIVGGEADGVREADLGAWRARVGPLLQAAGDRVRRAERPDPPDRRAADLVGARLRGADLRAADLRGALLVGADLRHADLRVASFLGADLRGADVAGADLRGALFLLPAQIGAARGDMTTHLPDGVGRPAAW